MEDYGLGMPIVIGANAAATQIDQTPTTKSLYVIRHLLGPKSWAKEKIRFGYLSFGALGAYM